MALDRTRVIAMLFSGEGGGGGGGRGGLHWLGPLSRVTLTRGEESSAALISTFDPNATMTARSAFRNALEELEIRIIDDTTVRGWILISYTLEISFFNFGQRSLYRGTKFRTNSSAASAVFNQSTSPYVFRYSTSAQDRNKVERERERDERRIHPLEYTGPS